MYFLLFFRIAMLVAACLLAIQGIAWQKSSMMLLTLSLGILGTILLFYGMRALISLLIAVGKSNVPLRVFNFRQIQENVVQQSTSLAISSMLILAALCCFGAGIGIANTSTKLNTHILDYTFAVSTNIALDKEPEPELVFPSVQTLLKENGLEDQFAKLFQMREGRINTTERTDEVFVLDAVIDEISRLPQSKDRDALLNNLGYAGLKDVLTDYELLLEEKHFVIKNEVKEERVFTDRRGLQFILGQIISNVIKYSTDSPMLIISTQHTVRDIILSITDNGSGVKSYDPPYIFQKGFTGDSTSNRNKATGMGLYLTKKMADDLNLRLDVESEYNRFFKISIFFPVS